MGTQYNTLTRVQDVAETVFIHRHNYSIVASQNSLFKNDANDAIKKQLLKLHNFGITASYDHYKPNHTPLVLVQYWDGTQADITHFLRKLPEYFQNAEITVHVYLSRANHHLPSLYTGCDSPLDLGYDMPKETLCALPRVFLIKSDLGEPEKLSKLVSLVQECSTATKKRLEDVSTKHYLDEDGVYNADDDTFRVWETYGKGQKWRCDKLWTNQNEFYEKTVGTPITTAMERHFATTCPISRIGFSRDNKILYAVQPSQGLCSVWDLEVPETRCYTVEAGVSDASFAPCGPLLLSSASRGLELYENLGELPLVLSSSPEKMQPKWPRLSTEREQGTVYRVYTSPNHILSHGCEAVKTTGSGDFIYEKPLYTLEPLRDGQVRLWKWESNAYSKSSAGLTGLIYLVSWQACSAVSTEVAQVP